MNAMCARSPPAARKRGISVSSMASSPLQTTTLPCAIRVPSGHLPPTVTPAAKPIAVVVLRQPGRPAKMCSLPCASHPGHSQVTGRVAMFVPMMILTFFRLLALGFAP